MFSNILLPLDGSELGEKALPVAQDLARAFSATVHLVQAASRQPELEAGRGSGFTSVQEAEFQRSMARRLVETQIAKGKEYLEGVAERLKTAGLKVETAIREGAADEKIVEYAKQHGVDLIVMGTHGHGRLRTFFLGSVTDRVVRSAVAPVLVLPAA